MHKSPTDILHIQHAAGTYGFERAIFLLPLLLKATGWRGKIVTTAKYHLEIYQNVLGNTAHKQIQDEHCQ